MPRIWAKTVSFDSIAIGDDLPILAKSETEETIKVFASIVHPAAADDSAVSERQGGTSYGAVVSSSSALVAYAGELLEKGFPVSNIMAQGSHIHLEVVRPVRPGDTLVLSGRVIGKQEEKDRGVVECQVTIENQDGETIALAQATVCW